MCFSLVNMCFSGVLGGGDDSTQCCHDQIRSLPCLVSHSLNLHCWIFLKLLDMLHGFLEVVTWICQVWYTWISLSCFMDFFKIDTCISLSCYMDLSKLLFGFVKVITWICQRCSMNFSPFAKQYRVEVWQRFQSSMKPLLWTKGQSTQCCGYVVPLAMFCCQICVSLGT